MRYSATEKYEIIRTVEESNLPVRQTLRRLGICKSAFHQWLKCYQDDGIDGLGDRKPSAFAALNRVPQAHRDAVIELALDKPALSPREIAVTYTDQESYFVSESTVYRILKAEDLITSPAYILMQASDQFQYQTRRVNELWQTDFAYFKIIGWGWYYLSTILDDYSRYIVVWRLCSSMSATDVQETLDDALDFTGLDQV